MPRRPPQFLNQDQGLQAGVSYAQQPQYAQSPEAQQLMTDTLQGKYLQEENPYIQGVIDAANRDTNRGLEQQLGNLSRASLRPGMLGSNIWSAQRQALQQDAAQAMADASNQTRAGVYEAERGRQNELLGLEQARNQNIWSDLTARHGQDLQQETEQARAVASARAGSAAAGAQLQAAKMNAQTQEAQIRANLMAEQGRLAEQARQFDAGMPLQWGQLLGGQIGQYGAQNNADLQSLGSLIGQQMGAQQGAANLTSQLGLGAAGLDLQGGAQQLQAAGMLPGYSAAGLAPMGMAGDFLSQIYSSDAGLAAARASANASRANASLADRLARDQMQFESAQNQWQYGDPSNAMQQYLGGLGMIGGLAGNTTTGHGTQPGAVVQQQSPFGNLLQLGLGAAMMFGTGGAGGAAGAVAGAV